MGELPEFVTCPTCKRRVSPTMPLAVAGRCCFTCGHPLPASGAPKMEPIVWWKPAMGGVDPGAPGGDRSVFLEAREEQDLKTGERRFIVHREAATPAERIPPIASWLSGQLLDLGLPSIEPGRIEAFLRGEIEPGAGVEELRAAAAEALRLDEAATEGPWSTMRTAPCCVIPHEEHNDLYAGRPNDQGDNIACHTASEPDAAFIARARELLPTLARALLDTQPPRPPAEPIDRETLGQEVRRVWIAWAKEQPSPKPSWLAPWEELAEPDREVGRRIGERLFALGEATGRHPEPVSWDDPRLDGDPNRGRVCGLCKGPVWAGSRYTHGRGLCVPAGGEPAAVQPDEGAKALLAKFRAMVQEAFTPGWCCAGDRRHNLCSPSCPRRQLTREIDALAAFGAASEGR